MSLDTFFEQCEDYCAPTNYVHFQWSAKGVGFGGFDFKVTEEGKITCMNEMMSKEFIKKMLCQMVDDCELLEN